MDKFNKLSYSFLKSRNEDIIPELFKLTIEKVKVWMRFQKRININELPKDFKEEVALTYISKLYEKTVNNEPHKVVFSISRNLSRKVISNKFSNSIRINKVIVEDIDEKLMMKEYLEKHLKNFSPYTISSLMYLSSFPESLKRMISLNENNPEFYIGLLKFLKIKNKFSNFNINVDSIKSDISKGLFLSALFKNEPAIAVLFLLLKDIKSFIQFCLLFEGKNIRIPKINDLKDIINKVNSISKNFDSDNKINDENLLLFSVEMNDMAFNENSFSITPVLNIFFKKSIESLIKNYEKFQNKIIDDVNVCSGKDISKIYDLFNKELNTQFVMFQSIIKSMEFLKMFKNTEEKENEKGNDREE